MRYTIFFFVFATAISANEETREWLSENAVRQSAREAVSLWSPLVLRETLIVLLPLILFKRYLPRFEPIVMFKASMLPEQYRVAFTRAHLMHHMSLRSLAFVADLAMASRQIPVQRFRFRVWLLSALSCIAYAWSICGSGDFYDPYQMDSIHMAFIAMHAPLYMTYYCDRYFHPTPQPLCVMEFPRALSRMDRRSCSRWCRTSVS